MENGNLLECGCEKTSTKNKCSDCGFYFCDKHLYIYVDGNNGAITKNSKLYCKNCYKLKYRY